jgi:hypothetical protein
LIILDLPLQRKFLDAAGKGDILEIQDLLRSGINVNVKDNDFVR